MFLTALAPVVRGRSLAERVLHDVWHSPLPACDAGPMAQANLHANENQVTVTVQIPSIDVASLDCSVHGDRLTISGRPVQAQAEGAPATDAKALVWLRRERSQDAFERTFQLPYTVDPDQTAATVHDGILSVTLHRHQADRPRRIVVTAA